MNMRIKGMLLAAGLLLSGGALAGTVTLDCNGTEHCVAEVVGFSNPTPYHFNFWYTPGGPGPSQQPCQDSGGNSGSCTFRCISQRPGAWTIHVAAYDGRAGVSASVMRAAGGQAPSRLLFDSPDGAET